MKQDSFWAAAAVVALLSSTPALAGDKQPPAADEQRSGAALNLEAAKNKGATFDPVLYPEAARFIRKAAVNNPGADASAQDTQSETSIVYLGNNRLVAGFNDSGSFDGGPFDHFTGYATSSDGGVNWTDRGKFPDSADGDAGDPVLARRALDNSVFAVTLGFSDARLQVFKSVDNGVTWAAPVNGGPGFAAGDFLDKPWMTVDNTTGAGNGNIYLCWRNFGPALNNIYFSRSTDAGATFGPSPGVVLTAGGQGCFITVSPNHQVSAFYFRTDAGPDNKLFMRQSTDQGLTFAPEVMVADLATASSNGSLSLKGGARSNSFPHAAVNPDPARPYIYVVYNDDPTPLNTADQNGDINLVLSKDAGATWSAPVKVDGAANDQFFPTIAFAAKGSLMVGYYSRVHDANNLAFHRRGRIGVLRADGTVNFRRSFQLGPNTPIAIAQDPVINSTYMGDYDQIAGGGGKFFSVWADNRDGNAFHAHQPDVFFAALNAATTATDLVLSLATNKTTMPQTGVAKLTMKVLAKTGTARDVVASLAIPPGLKFVSSNSMSCNQTVNGLVDCIFGRIGKGKTRTVEIKVMGTVAGPTNAVAARVTTASKEVKPANNAKTRNIAVTAVATVNSTHTSGSIATLIPDVSTTEVSLPVAVTGKVIKISPSFRLNHTFDADLDIFLISPDGTTVELTTDNGGVGDNFGSGSNDCTGTPTVFDDAAPTSIVGSVAPFAGTFKPEGSLADFFAKSPSGTWKLRMIDDLGGDTGTIGCFSLSIDRKP